MISKEPERDDEEEKGAEYACCIGDANTNANEKQPKLAKGTIAARLCSISNRYIVVLLVVKQISEARGVPYVDDAYNNAAFAQL